MWTTDLGKCRTPGLSSNEPDSVSGEALLDTTQPITEFLDECEELARSGLNSEVVIEDEASFPDPASLHVAVPRWKRMFDVVAVVGDMKSSTALSFREHPKTSAKIYEAVTGNMVRILDYYEPDFVDIQGDGVFGLFHGEKAAERGLCASISLTTFSRLRLTPLIDSLMPPEVPSTGIKTGMAMGTLTAKRVGIRGTEEPVWAGKPVNWAFKCAQAAEAHELVITNTVWDHFKLNDWVVWSCGCANGVPANAYATLWKPTLVTALPNEECHRLESYWCPRCGDDFHEAILEGETKRSDVSGTVS